jgi:rhamnosyltransferase
VINNLYPKNTVSSVAAAIILYNPKDDVIQNIESYINQVSHLYILDNSKILDLSIKKYIIAFNKIDYIFNGRNLGIATSLNIAAGKAIEKKYSYLLTMDQDSKAPINLVETLLDTANKSDKPGLISPLHSNIFDTHQRHIDSKITIVNSVMTSGNLISLDAYTTVGGFNEDLFIDYVDVDYCLRLKSSGFNIYKIHSIILEHNEANLTEKKILNMKIYPTNNDPQRMYYKTRNLLYLNSTYSKKYSKIVRNEFSIYLRSLIKILFLEKQKYLKIKMILMGITDYLKKQKGRKF